MPVVALTNRRTFFGLYAPEVLILLFGVIAVQLFAMFGIPLRRPLALYTERVLGNFQFYFIGVVLASLLLRLYHLQLTLKLKRADRDKQESASDGGGAKIDPNAVLPLSFTWQEYRRKFLSPKSILFDLRMINAISAMFVVFIHLKHLIPRINPFLFDHSFATMEYSMFGKLMTVWLVQKLGSGVAPFLSDGYQIWYPYLGICSLVMILQRNRLLAEEYSAGFILMWMLGIVSVYLAPSWGPCFYFQQQISAVVPITKMTEVQAGLWKMKEFVSANPSGAKGLFLISGFPSLHFAATLFCTYYLARLYRPFAVASGLFAILTFFTTINFGWHYLIDDIGAVLLVGAVLLITRRFYRTQLLFVEPRPEVIKMGTI